MTVVKSVEKVKEAEKAPKDRNPWWWLSILSVVGGIVAWWLASLTLPTLPSPAEVVVRGIDLFQRGILGSDILASLRRVLTGFAIGSGLAIPLGFAMGWYRPIRALIEPWTQFFRTVPPLVIIP